MQVKELGHAVLYVRDLEKSRHFYGDILGFEQIGGGPPGMPAVAFNSTSGRTHHELLLIEVGPDAAPIPAGRHVGLYHLGLKVGETDDELRAALAELQARRRARSSARPITRSRTRSTSRIPTATSSSSTSTSSRSCGATTRPRCSRRCGRSGSDRPAYSASPQAGCA